MSEVSIRSGDLSALLSDYDQTTLDLIKKWHKAKTDKLPDGLCQMMRTRISDRIEFLIEYKGMFHPSQDWEKIREKLREEIRKETDAMFERMKANGL